MADEAEIRTAELLDVATQVFLEYGYERAKMSYVVNRAGGSKRTLYSRYPTKSDLFTAVVDKQTAAIERDFTKTLSTKGTLPALLEEFGTTLFHTMYHPERGKLFRITVAEAEHFPELARRFLDAGPNRAVKMLGDCLERHSEFRGDNAKEAAESFCSLCLGVALLQQLLDSNSRITEKGKKDRLRNAIRLFMAAYRVKSK